MAKRYPQTILVSCEIPWSEKEELLEDNFRQEVRSTLANGFNHVYLFGTAGEGYAITTTQAKEIVQIFVQETEKEDVYPMIGAIGMSTPQVVERVGLAYDMGIREFQIALPPWGPLNDVEYMTFFKDVCGSFPDAKFLHYNLPRASRVLLATDYRRIEAQVPNLVATKNTQRTAQEVYALETETSEIQHFYGEWNFPIGCLFGECSLLSSWGALFPTQTKEFFNYGVTGQFDKLAPLQGRFIKAGSASNAIRSGQETPGQARPGIDGAYDKMIVRASGVDMPLRLLSPYQSFGQEEFETWVNALRERLPDWMS